MPTRREEIIAERMRLKTEFGELFHEVAALLFRHDPIRIKLENNTDEYEPETGTILPKLRSCSSADDVRKVVHREFCRWFNADIAGPEHHYDKIATEIWELWRRFGAASM